MTRKYILGEEIEALAQGSYERRVIGVNKAIREAAKSLFGKEVVFETYATFQDHAVVVVEGTGDVFRVQYSESAKGEIFPLGVEQLSVPTYTKEQFAAKQAKAYVAAFMSGAKTSAQEHFQSLAQMIPSVVVPAQAKVLAEQFETLIQADCGWKRIFSEKQKQIQESAGDISGIRPIKAKFAKISDGSIAESDWPRFEPLVTSDTKYLRDKLDAVLAKAENAVESLAGFVPALQENSDDPTLKMFRAFAEDFAADTKAVANSLAEALEVTNRLDVRAKLADVLAIGLHRYEVAGNFVDHQARRLRSTQT